MVEPKLETGFARGIDRETPGPCSDRVSSRLRQPRFDAPDQFLSKFRTGAGALGLVRTLGHARSEAGVYVRVRRALHLGLDHVSRMVQGPARVRQRPGAVGVLPRGMELSTPGRSRLSDQQGGGGQPAMGGQTVSGRKSLASLGLSKPGGLTGL